MLGDSESDPNFSFQDAAICDMLRLLLAALTAPTTD
jgi:hypothetical protein